MITEILMRFFLNKYDSNSHFYFKEKRYLPEEIPLSYISVNLFISQSSQYNSCHRHQS
jgi:hypothetical protein